MGAPYTLKNYILSNYNQEVILSKYLEIPLEEIQYAIKFNRNIINHHRKTDTNPSLKIYYDKNKLRIYDYGSILYRGDIFDVVAISLNLNSTIVTDFITICNHIINNYSKYTEVLTTSIEKARDYFEYEYRNYDKSELAYFHKGNITKQHLLNRGVYLTKYVKINNGIFSLYNKKDPTFIYKDAYLNGNELVKFYRPFADKSLRFRTNNNLPIEGVNELYKSEILCITKSKKDRLTIESLYKGNIPDKLDRVLKKLDIPEFIEYPYTSPYSSGYEVDDKLCITNLTSESILLNKDTITFLKSNHDKIIINFDYDLTGLTNGFIYYILYGLTPIYIGGDKDLILHKITKDIQTVINNKFKQLSLNITIEDFKEFIIEHSDKYLEKDIFELSSRSKKEAKTFVNERIIHW